MVKRKTSPTAARKTPRKRKKNSNNKPSSFTWLATGLLVIAFIAGIFYLDKLNNQPVFAHKTLAHQHAATNNPDFEFYTALPSGELTNKPTTVNPSKPTPAPVITKPTDTVSQDNSSYFFQVAAFNQASDAEKLRMQLLMNNLKANTASYIKENKTWYRVIVGPYQLNDTKQVQAELTKMHLSAFRLEMQ